MSKSSLVLHAVLCLLCMNPGAAPAAAGLARAGFAERNVSPEIGMEAPGGYGKSYHRTFHDPCMVRAAVFEDAGKRVAIVGIDALIIRKETVNSVRAKITVRTGIPVDHVMISASHTHSGGPTGMLFAEEFRDASPLVRELVEEKTVVANPKYLEKVEAGILEAVVEADSKKVEARCGAGFGIEGTVAFNRRFKMKNGITYTHPGQGNPDIVEPAGPIDPQVGVLGAWSAKDGAFLGCIVNYACHATTSPGGISGDYIHYIEKTVRGLMGDKAVVVFLPGAAGDVTQVDNRSPYQIKQSGEISARKVGGLVGAEALKTLLALEQSAGTASPLNAKSKILKIARRKPRAERLAKAKELVAKDPKTVDPTDWTFAKELVVFEARIAKEPVADVEIQAIQVGPAIYLSCPAEYFCQFGLDIKAGSKFPFTFPVSMANDCIGYVPTEEALTPGPLGGGYETRLTSYSNLEPKAGRTIADGLVDLSRLFTPGSVPAPALIGRFNGKPWSYGNLPPERD